MAAMQCSCLVPTVFYGCRVPSHRPEQEKQRMAVANRAKATLRSESVLQLTKVKSPAACKRPANTRSAGEQTRYSGHRLRAYLWHCRIAPSAARVEHTADVSYWSGKSDTSREPSAHLYLRSPFPMDWLSLGIGCPVGTLEGSEIVPRTESLPADPNL